MRMRLFPVPEPGSGISVIETEPDSVKGEDAPFIVGTQGDLDLLCGTCERVLATGQTSARQMVGVVIRCPRCGGYNATRT